MRRLIPLLAIALAVPAGAAERSVQVSSFTRLRVEAPVVVTLAAGSPRAAVPGDPRAVEALEVRDSGGTLTVRLRSGAPVPAEPLRVTLASPGVASITVSGGAQVSAEGLRAPRVDLALGGGGTLAVRGIDAPALTLIVVGNGNVTLAGRAGSARLTTSGAGEVDASALVAGDLVIATDGAGETRAAARYTAAVTNTGSGQVTVAGTPKCTIRSGSRGPVKCGAEVR